MTVWDHRNMIGFVVADKLAKKKNEKWNIKRHIAWYFSKESRILYIVRKCWGFMLSKYDNYTQAHLCSFYLLYFTVFFFTYFIVVVVATGWKEKYMSMQEKQRAYFICFVSKQNMLNFLKEFFLFVNAFFGYS